jgi:hypothetical protein
MLNWILTAVVTPALASMGIAITMLAGRLTPAFPG